MNNETAVRILQEMRLLCHTQEENDALVIATDALCKLGNRTIDEVLEENSRIGRLEDLDAETGDYEKVPVWNWKGKAKVGDRFVLEVAEAIPCECGNTIYRMRGFNTLIFDGNGIRRLVPYFGGYDEGYLDGSRDAHRKRDEEEEKKAEKHFNAGYEVALREVKDEIEWRMTGEK